MNETRTTRVFKEGMEDGYNCYQLFGGLIGYYSKGAPMPKTGKIPCVLLRDRPIEVKTGDYLIYVGDKLVEVNTPKQQEELYGTYQFNQDGESIVNKWFDDASPAIRTKIRMLSIDQNLNFEQALSSFKAYCIRSAERYKENGSLIDTNMLCNWLNYYCMTKRQGTLYVESYMEEHKQELINKIKTQLNSRVWPSESQMVSVSKIWDELAEFATNEVSDGREMEDVLNEFFGRE